MKNVLDQLTNKYPCACPTSVNHPLMPRSTYVLFMIYSNSNKVIIYFDPKTRRIKKTLHCYIDEYGAKLYPE